jgi:hypothetical protein
MPSRNNRGDRRPEIVRHRPQHRRLQLVTSAQCSRLHSLRLHGITVKHYGHKGLERRNHMGLQPLKRFGRQVARHNQRGDLLAAGVPQRQCNAPIGVVDRAELNRSRRKRKRLAKTMGGCGQRRRGVSSRQELARQISSQICLDPAPFGLNSAAAREIRHRTHRRRDDRERRQRHPVARRLVLADSAPLIATLPPASGMALSSPGVTLFGTGTLGDFEVQLSSKVARDVRRCGYVATPSVAPQGGEVTRQVDVVAAPLDAHHLLFHESDSRGAVASDGISVEIYCP